MNVSKFIKFIRFKLNDILDEIDSSSRQYIRLYTGVLF